MNSGNPTLRMRQLAEMLRALREAKGLTIDEAAEALRISAPSSQRWSRSKISRLELYQQHAKPAEVEQLADLYNASPENREALINLARDSREKVWWRHFPLPTEFLPLLTLEQSALGIRQFELSLVPGLLQTPDYARALMKVNTQINPEELDDLVSARILRQRIIMRRDNPIKYHAILDETVLRRPVGSPETMKNQIKHLITAQQNCNISIQIIPFKIGPHVGLEGGFTILTLPEPFGDKGYVEGAAGAFYLESIEKVRESTLRFGSLTAKALDPTSSLKLIDAILMEY